MNTPIRNGSTTGTAGAHHRPVIKAHKIRLPAHKDTATITINLFMRSALGLRGGSHAPTEGEVLFCLRVMPIWLRRLQEAAVCYAQCKSIPRRISCTHR